MENKTNPVNAVSSEPLALIFPDGHRRTFWKDAVMKYPDISGISSFRSTRSRLQTQCMTRDANEP